MADYHYYEPRNGHGLAHNPLKAIIAPRPIGWISTISEQGVANLAPYSFFNIFNDSPPIIGFSSHGRKDSLTNAAATGEFVWNLVTRRQAEPMNNSALAVPADADEFDLAGLSKMMSKRVLAPRVAGSPVHLECKVSQVVHLKDKDAVATNQWLVLGEVVAVHIDGRFIEDGIFQTTKSGLIARGGGTADYFCADENNRFVMERPVAPAPAPRTE